MGYRYIGAKTKILKEVLLRIQQIVKKGAHVTDLMCGTAAVSAGLRGLDYRVSAADVMTYSYHHARVALHFTTSPSFTGAADFIEKANTQEEFNLFPKTPYENIIDALNATLPVKGYFWREFSSLFIDHLFKQAINNYEGSATVILLGTSSEFKSFSKGLSKHPDGYGKLRRML